VAHASGAWVAWRRAGAELLLCTRLSDPSGRPQDAFLDAIERGSASLRSGHDDEQSRELRALSNIRCAPAAGCTGLNGQPCGGNRPRRAACTLARNAAAWRRGLRTASHAGFGGRRKPAGAGS
jgi:hypothetical protein